MIPVLPNFPVELQAKFINNQNIYPNQVFDVEAQKINNAKTIELYNNCLIKIKKNIFPTIVKISNYYLPDIFINQVADKLREAGYNVTISLETMVINNPYSKN